MAYVDTRRTPIPRPDFDSIRAKHHTQYHTWLGAVNKRTRTFLANYDVPSPSSTILSLFTTPRESVGVPFWALHVPANRGRLPSQALDMARCWDDFRPEPYIPILARWMSPESHWDQVITAEYVESALDRSTDASGCATHPRRARHLSALRGTSTPSSLSSITPTRSFVPNQFGVTLTYSSLVPTTTHRLRRVGHASLP